MKRFLAAFFVLALFCSSAHAMGGRAQVFEVASDGGIWDHGSEFYLRIDLSELAGLEKPQFIWAGFHEQKAGQFTGELVVDDFGPNERRFPARASLVITNAKARYFFIEIMDAEGLVLKEIFVKSFAH